MNEITRDEFERFEFVRRSGRWNMLMESRSAANEANLSHDTYMAILKDYTRLAERFPIQQTTDRSK